MHNNPLTLLPSAAQQTSVHIFDSKYSFRSSCIYDCNKYVRFCLICCCLLVIFVSSEPSSYCQLTRKAQRNNNNGLAPSKI